MKKKIAIIGASYLQEPLIQKAKNIGLETHVFAWEVGDPGETLADYFYPISIIEKEQITEICNNLKIDGICTIASDLAVKTVNYVANRLGLPGNSLESTQLSTDKVRMREIFNKNSDPSCKSRVVFPEDNPLNKIEATHSWPLIIKPSDRSGSRGIYLANTESEIIEGVNAARQESFNQVVLIEDYVLGDEYSVEYISQNGKHHFLTATKKLTTGAPHFIEKGHIQPSGLSVQMIEKVKKVVEHALNSLDIKQGASHTEIKIYKDDITIIEIGARMGGDCIGSHLVPLTTGYDYCRMVIECALNWPISMDIHEHHQSAEVHFIMDDKELLNFKKTLQVENNVTAIPYLRSSQHEEVKDSSTRLGCYIIANN
ncbi:ATP-grasp domain-containing protein [Ileibacterium valens]|uniref:ATP-grasp domain-containing protein n=1 Tax=Ileibacterium valens TaxID=1862668 RepID=A0A1U7NDU3_9FIRM|nr:ATP-grasp domain-containing protein [Ileibacterium valens]OLU37526.1 hypothetical protein BO222_10485 [Ileibacterium valens]OLU39374.1 hypothetical protein BM735_07580 [Erysipelotrichaceae bacterium NYU-BL-F16]OLU42079.1 hypothetical protein BO224_02500 [Erysipelotrichaceae bacterium NYU-BL-E8]